MLFLRKYFFHSPVHYVVALVLNVFFSLLVLWLKGFDKLFFYVDAFSVAGALSVLFGLLLLVSALGAFNTFGYAFSYFRAERRYKDLYEYTLAKQEKQAMRQKTYMPYIVVGVVFLIMSWLLSQGVTI
ncbi:MAG: DUF3899 domain-containing protein [Lachnospiraceae bacterium]|nr:DUF3899 domain-containing protein [Lachnospiraceae bacterium]